MDQMNVDSKNVFAKTGVAVINAWDSIFSHLHKKVKKW